MMVVTDDMPCDCHQCHACAILGIAYPVARPVAVAEPEPPPRVKPQSAATLFDNLPTKETL